MENKEEFLKEYEELVRKYKIIIDGCGCIGSPCLSTLDYYQHHKTEEEVIADHINWLK